MAPLRKDLALKAIRHLITSGEFRQGHKFSENELVKRLGVSRSPIRDALATLVNEGLVEQIPQIGARVTVFTDSDFRELFYVRELLEVFAAQTLAAIGTLQHEGGILKVLLNAMMQHADQGNVGAFLESDVEFHWRTAELAGLRFICDTLKQVGNRVRITGFLSSPTPPSMRIVIDEHRNILQNIMAGNSEGAGSAALFHINATRGRIEAARSSIICS